MNSLVRVHDKSGSPLTRPFKLSTLFGPLGNRCSRQDQGDPIVLYDQLADRWLLSQFDSGGNMCVAISQTGDPTRAYFLYYFDVIFFNDYPHFGVWPDGYYMTSESRRHGDPHQAAPWSAFDRQQMLGWNRATCPLSPSTCICIFDVLPGSIGVAGGLPSDLDGLKSSRRAGKHFCLRRRHRVVIRRMPCGCSISMRTLPTRPSRPSPSVRRAPCR